ncbi:uncharacterized protein LOC122658309 [Telopea speciosissima]|uniref:uncharacterized protein LOC122658309 n=1 Tax=Telopea speciosissima TaxID=54955 RepID=UPI001CC4FFCC|nr:uncharacterized protein LOC122658309 [Telopea speciosissima]
MLRLSKKAFYSLRRLIEDRGFLSHSKSVQVEEQLVIFLHTIAHNVKNRMIKNNFGHSSETISRYFNKRVPIENHCRFRDRKGNISQNILAACDHDTRFTNILSGWEGSTVDSRILDEAIHRHGKTKLVVPLGKYYLVDVGFANKKGFLRPYCNVWYHLKEWKNSNLSSADKKELFNLRHIKLRSIIERAFGLLKSRFKILKSRSEFPYKTQVKIVLACVLLHNHILTQNSVEEEEEWVAQDARNAGPSSNGQFSQGETDEENEVEDDGDTVDQFRDEIADMMWAAWMTVDMNAEDIAEDSLDEYSD